VEPAQVGATEPGGPKLSAEERHRNRPHAVELVGEALLLQPAEPLQRHRLDRGVVVAALAHRFTTASAKPGGPAVSGTSPSGTSATSIWISTVALRRSASVRQSASASAGGRDQLTRAARADGRAALRVQELAEEVVRVEVHARVHAALARHRADLRLADVVEKLDTERRLELLAERRRQRLGGREADAVGQP